MLVDVHEVWTDGMGGAEVAASPGTRESHPPLTKCATVVKE